MFAKKPIFAAEPAIHEVVRQIAMLGGFRRKCDADPGVELLWLGIRRLRDFVGGVALGRDWLDAPGFELIEGDLANEGEVAKAIEGCDVCYHLVSTTCQCLFRSAPV